MSDFKKLISLFCDLGGQFDNAKIRSAEFGLGIFPIDDSQKVNIFVPEHLLFSIEDYVLNEELNLYLNAKNKPSELTETFFRLYHSTVGWEKSLPYIRGVCLAWTEIPILIKDLLVKFGMVPGFLGELSNALLFDRYCNSRKIGFVKNKQNLQVLMPVIELINHNDLGIDYKFQRGIKIEARVKGEVMANYASGFDPFRQLVSYDFSSEAQFVYSIPISLNRNGASSIHIASSPSSSWNDSPSIIIKNGEIHISHLQLYNKCYPENPLVNFKNLMKINGFNDGMAQRVFELIVAENRNAFLNLMALLDTNDFTLRGKLKLMAEYQLMGIELAI